MDRDVSEAGDGFTFIGGTGRSGTNALKEALALHPAVGSLPFEHRFTTDPDGVFDFYRSHAGTWSPFIADRRIERLRVFLVSLASEPALHRAAGNLITRLDPAGRFLSPRKYHGWELERHFPGYVAAVEELIDSLSDLKFRASWAGMESYRRRPEIRHAPPMDRADLAPILGDFLSSVIGKALAKQGRQHWVEDNTWTILFGRELFEILPGAKLVHIYRDPRDVVSSLMEQRWAPSDPVRAGRWYRSIMDRWRDLKGELPQNRVIEMGLEDLAGDPAAHLRTLCAFIGLDDHRPLLGFDFDRTNQGRWKRDLSGSDLSRLEPLIGELLTDLGYA